MENASMPIQINVSWINKHFVLWICSTTKSNKVGAESNSWINETSVSSFKNFYNSLYLKFNHGLVCKNIIFIHKY